MGIKNTALLSDTELKNIRYYTDTLNRVKALGYLTIAEWVYSELIIKRLSSFECAKQLNITDRTVISWARKLGFTIRSRGGKVPGKSTRYWSKSICKKNPAHAICGKTLRYVYKGSSPSRSKHGRCVQCYKEYGQKRKEKINDTTTH